MHGSTLIVLSDQLHRDFIWLANHHLGITVAYDCVR